MAQACHQQRGLTFAALALLQLEGEDDVFVIAAKLAHKALRLAELGNIESKNEEDIINREIPLLTLQQFPTLYHVTTISLK